MENWDVPLVSRHLFTVIQVDSVIWGFKFLIHYYLELILIFFDFFQSVERIIAEKIFGTSQNEK